VLRQVNTVHTFPSYSFQILFKTFSSRLCPDLPWNLFLLGGPTKSMCTFVFSPIHATHTIQLIFAQLMAMMLAEECQSLRLSLCNILHRPLASCHVRSNIIASTLFSRTLNQFSSLSVRDKAFHPYNTYVRQDYSFVGQVKFTL
jgi:hypothetical protein